MTTEQKREADKQFLIEGIAHDVIVMLMDDNHLSMDEAMDTLFNSSTFENFEDEKTGPHSHTPAYIRNRLTSEKTALNKI